MIYWSVFFVAAFVSLTNFVKDGRSVSLFIFCYLYLFFLFFVGFRYASIDYFGYLAIFEATNFNEFSFPLFTTSVGTSGNEFIYASISSLFKILGLSFYNFMFFVAFLSVSIKFYYFKKFTPYFLLSIVIYISMGFIKDMSQIRNGLSGAILLLGVQPIVKREFAKFFLVVILAFGVQVFALIALPLYWLYAIFQRARFFVVAVLAILSVVSVMGGVSELILNKIDIMPFVPSAVIRKLEGYSDNSTGRIGFFTITGFSYICISLLFVFFKEKIFGKSNKLFFFGVMHTYGVFLFLLFTGIDTVTSRSLDLFSSTSLPFLMLTPLYFFHGVQRIVLVYVIIVFCALKLYSGTDTFAPYQNILFL
jgi:hypothetical protein